MTGSMSKPREDTPLVPQKQPTLTSRLWASTCLVVTSGTGLFADGYDLLVIDLVTADISHLHPEAMGPREKGFAVSMTLLGVVLGQLSFGSIADIVGAKAASMATAFLIAVGAFTSACVTQSPGFPLAAQLGVCRLVLGLGVGGEYPVSAALGVEGHGSIEGSCSGAFFGSRAQLQTLIAGMFNLGAVLTGLIVLVLLSSGMSLEAVWRWALGLGGTPAVLALFLRALLPTGDQRDRAHDADGDQSRHVGYAKRFWDAVGPRRLVLLGACLNWMLFNLTMYGQSSFRSIISERIWGSTEQKTVRDIMHQNAVFSVTMSCFTLIGTVVATQLVDKMWRYQLQLLGFGGSAVAMWVCGGLLGLGNTTDQLDTGLAVCNYVWVILYVQVSVTTYLIAAECFPSSARATCFGIAAASGKIGAMAGTWLFPVCEARFGLEIVLLASGCVSLLGALATFLLTPRVDVDPAKLDAEQSKEDNAFAYAS